MRSLVCLDSPPLAGPRAGRPMEGTAACPIRLRPVRRWVQIGTEGGVLPAPVVIPATPVGYNYNRRDIVVTNVQEHALFLGPAERADVIVDLSNVRPGIYPDALQRLSRAGPRLRHRLDYYTGDPDLTDTGGAPSTQPGYGPNIRTVMQIHVTGASTSAGFNLATLQSATGIPKVFHDTQPRSLSRSAPIAPVAMGTTGLPTQRHLCQNPEHDGLDLHPRHRGTGFAPSAITQPIINKAIHELFESDYGKMNSILAAEIPLTNFNNQTTIPLAYVDPPTDIVATRPDPIWKVTHNGVDSHAIHFHLFNVQLINRVGWDGAIRPADPNELGWKETVRMNPLEDAIVAIRAHPSRLFRVAS
jgi:FtsP/CotA-like multicopper oxidase with cupredoxin domain